MSDDDAVRRAQGDRDAAEDERDDADSAARDFARALRQVIEADADVWRIATEALAKHPEYDVFP